jgi:hypothetical protein
VTPDGVKRYAVVSICDGEFFTEEELNLDQLIQTLGDYGANMNARQRACFERQGPGYITQVAGHELIVVCTHDGTES